jgi:hypothetical protein
MRSFQDKLMDRFEEIAKQHDCELIQQEHWANTGKLIAQPTDEFRPVAYLNYQIQSGHSVIEFNGNELSGRDTSALFSETDGDKITAMFAKWRQLVTDGVKAGKPVEEGNKRGTRK